MSVNSAFHFKFEKATTLEKISASNAKLQVQNCLDENQKCANSSILSNSLNFHFLKNSFWKALKAATQDVTFLHINI